MSEPVGVVAVIVTYRRARHLDGAVSALRAQTSPIDEIVVVDNGCDGAAEAAFGSTEGVTVIETGDNLGAAGGFSVGLEYAASVGARWVYLLNDDDRPRPHAIATLLARLDDDVASESIVGVGACASVGGIQRPVGATFRGGLRYTPYDERPDDEIEVDTTTFSGLLLRVRDALDVGGIAADYFMMWEEYDLCLRLRRAGGRIVILSEVLVDLPGHESEGPYPPWRSYYEARNSYITLRSIGGLHGWRWWSMRQAKHFVAAATLPAPFTRMWLRLRGILDGIRGRTGRLVEVGP